LASPDTLLVYPLATVLERVREIGVSRALGAYRCDIRFQFVVEALRYE
jgi:ABC-type antimicrobial peptide transport system permease subunit